VLPAAGFTQQSTGQFASRIASARCARNWSITRYLPSQQKICGHWYLAAYLGQVHRYFSAESRGHNLPREVQGGGGIVEKTITTLGVHEPVSPAPTGGYRFAIP
jgi:hypothetical protein